MNEIDVSTLKTKRSSNNRIFWGLFWLTILSLAIIYVGATWYGQKLIVDQAGRVAVSESYIKEWREKVLPGYLDDMDTEIVLAKKEIETVIDRQLDIAFGPVTKQIPKLADFHFSVTGSYLELIAAGSGDAGKEMTRILFEETRFSEKLEHALGRIQGDGIPIIARTLENLHRKLQQQANLSHEEMALISKVAALSLADAEERFSSGFIAIRGASSLIGAATVTSVLTKAVAEKVTVALVGKASVKAAGVGGGAATGATIGSALGPGGAAIGGIVGGLSFWLATDKLIVEVDEMFNRQAFITEVENLIDTEKQLIRKRLLALYHNHLHAIAEHNRKSLKAISTTRELIEGQGHY